MSPEAVGAANVVIITAARLFLIPPTSVSVLYCGLSWRTTNATLNNCPKVPSVAKTELAARLQHIPLSRKLGDSR